MAAQQRSRGRTWVGCGLSCTLNSESPFTLVWSASAPLDGFAETISVVAMRSFDCRESGAGRAGAIAFSDMLLLIFVSVGA